MMRTARLNLLYLLITLIGLAEATSSGLYCMEAAQNTAGQNHTPTKATAPLWKKKKKKKKPTIMQTWTKVAVLDWENLDSHDGRNIALSVIVASIAYAIHTSFFEKRSVNKGKHIVPRRPKNSKKDEIAPLKPLTSAWSDATLEQIREAHVSYTPCRQQGYLECGDHAAANAHLMIEHLQNNPAATHEELGSYLTSPESIKFITNGLGKTEVNGKLVIDPEAYNNSWVASINQKRSKESHKDYLVSCIRRCALRPTSWFDKILCGLGLKDDTRFTPKDNAEIRNIGSLIANKIEEDDITDVDFDSLVESILIKAREKDGNPDMARQALASLRQKLDLTQWQHEVTQQLEDMDTFKAKAASTRSRDLGSDEISTILDEHFKQGFKVALHREYARNENGTVKLDEDDAPIVLEEKIVGDNPQGRITIIEHSPRVLLSGTMEHDKITRIKEELQSNDTFVHGFVVRLTNSAETVVRYIKGIKPDNRAVRAEKVANLGRQESSSHWISLVVHKHNGTINYYVTDSIASTRNEQVTSSASVHSDIKVLIEALHNDDCFR